MLYTSPRRASITPQSQGPGLGCSVGAPGGSTQGGAGGMDWPWVHSDPQASTHRAWARQKWQRLTSDHTDYPRHRGFVPRVSRSVRIGTKLTVALKGDPGGLGFSRLEKADRQDSKWRAALSDCCVGWVPPSRGTEQGCRSEGEVRKSWKKTHSHIQGVWLTSGLRPQWITVPLPSLTFPGVLVRCETGMKRRLSCKAPDPTI